jgi:hypothetical protein
VLYQPEQETLADPLDVVDLGFELADEMEPATVAVEAIVIAALAVHLGLAAASRFPGPPTGARCPVVGGQDQPRAGAGYTSIGMSGLTAISQRWPSGSAK